MTWKTKLLLQFNMAKRKKMPLISCCSLLQTKSGSGASCCCNQAVAHPTWSSFSPVGQETVWPSILSSPCGLKWSNFKAKRDQRLLQDGKGSPARSRGWSGYQPQISLHKYTKTNEGSSLCPKWSLKLLNELHTYICVVQCINWFELKKVINFWAR